MVQDEGDDERCDRGELVTVLQEAFGSRAILNLVQAMISRNRINFPASPGSQMTLENASLGREEIVLGLDWSIGVLAAG